MSSHVHSGFLNPQQEGYYCRLMEKLIQTLQSRLLDFYRNSQIDERKFQKRILKLSFVLDQCEKHKSLEPQFSLHFDELKEFLREKYYEGTGRNDPTSVGSNLSRITGLSPTGSLRRRENEGSLAGDTVGHIDPVELASRGSRSKAGGKRQQTGLPFKLNQEFDEAPNGNTSSQPKPAPAFRTNREARARSAEAGRRRLRGDLQRSKATSGILGYSYRQVQKDRVQSNKSLSSFHSQKSPAVKDTSKRVKNGFFIQNRYSMEEVPNQNFSDIVHSHLKTSDDEVPKENMQLSLSCERITEADQEDCSLIVDENQNGTPKSSDEGRRKLKHNSQSKMNPNGDLESRKQKLKTDSMSRAHEPTWDAPSSNEPVSQMSQIYLHKPINFNQMNQQVQQLQPAFLMQSLSRLQPVVIPEKLGHDGNPVMMETEQPGVAAGAGAEGRTSRPRSRAGPTTQQNVGRYQARGKQHLAQRIPGPIIVEPAEPRSSKGKLLHRAGATSTRRERARITARTGQSYAAGGSHVGALADLGRKGSQRDYRDITATVKKILNKANQQQLAKNQLFLDKHTPSLYQRNHLGSDRPSVFAPKMPEETGLRIHKPSGPLNEKRTFLTRRNPSRKAKTRTSSSNAPKISYSSRKLGVQVHNRQPAVGLAGGVYSSIPTSSQQCDLQEASVSDLMQSSLVSRQLAKGSGTERVEADPAAPVKPYRKTDLYVSKQRTRLGRIRQLEVYQGAGEVPDELDDYQADHEQRIEYTLTNGGMLEEPSADCDGLSAQPSQTSPLKGETDRLDKPGAQADSRTSKCDKKSRNGQESVQQSSTTPDPEQVTINTIQDFATLGQNSQRQPSRTQCLDSRTVFAGAATGGTLGIAKEKFVVDDSCSEQMTERNTATPQRIRSGAEEAPMDTEPGPDAQAVSTSVFERRPSKKRYGHQPSQVASRLVGKSETAEEAIAANPGRGTAETRPQAAGRSTPGDLREFSFAEEGPPSRLGEPSTSPQL